MHHEISPQEAKAIHKARGLFVARLRDGGKTPAQAANITGACVAYCTLDVQRELDAAEAKARVA